MRYVSTAIGLLGLAVLLFTTGYGAVLGMVLCLWGNNLHHRPQT